MHNNANDIKWKVLKYYQKDQVTDHMRKSTEEPFNMQWMDPNLLKVEILHILTLGRNKTQNRVFNLKQLVDDVFLSLEVGEMVTPQGAKMWSLFTRWELHAKGLSKMCFI